MGVHVDLPSSTCYVDGWLRFPCYTYFYALHKWLVSYCCCKSMNGHARTFSDQVIASIIDDSRCRVSDVAFRPITNWWAFLYTIGVMAKYRGVAEMILTAWFNKRVFYIRIDIMNIHDVFVYTTHLYAWHVFSASSSNFTFICLGIFAARRSDSF